MWKIVIGFGSVIFFIAMIVIAVYYIKQYLDEKNGATHNKQESDFRKSLDPLSGDVLEEIGRCISFLSFQAMGTSSLKELSQEIIIPLEKMMRIIERYPDKSNNMQDLTEYLIPLIMKLADDYCFYYQHSNKGDNSNKAVETCEEGLKEISRILYIKADSMLEDRFYDIHSEVAVLLQTHSANQL